MSEWTPPNVRRAFLPDRDHILFDVDLSGADAQVVAWEANEPELKRAFRAGVDIHNFNGRRIWGDTYDPRKIRRKLTWRDECKRGVHGANYVGGVRALQGALGWSMAEVEQFKSTWFRKNPNILRWHQRVDDEVRRFRTIRNAFGFRIVYFDRPDGLLPEALAWIAQGTVAIVTARAALRMSKVCPWAPLLLQVHDSLVFQLPFHKETPQAMAQIKAALEVEIPFPGDPRIIPWGIKRSERSWGDLTKRSWQDYQ